MVSAGEIELLGLLLDLDPGPVDDSPGREHVDYVCVNPLNLVIVLLEHPAYKSEIGAG